MSLVEDKYHDMMAAVHHNDLAAFENQLTRFDDPSNDFHLHRCCYSKTLDNVLHVIAQLGRVDFLNALITKHPNDLDLEIKNADGKTPLHEAAQFSQPGIVLTILGQRQVCVDPIKRGDWTPLMLACTKTGQESLQVVDILIKHGANIALVNKVRLQIIFKI
jgi:ankyrin repeat protein